MIDGKRVMFTRVHGMLDDQYENPGHDAEVNAYVEQLTNAYNAGGINSLMVSILSFMNQGRLLHSFVSKRGKRVDIVIHNIYLDDSGNTVVEIGRSIDGG
jgi:hypothetical protein